MKRETGNGECWIERGMYICCYALKHITKHVRWGEEKEGGRRRQRAECHTHTASPACHAMSQSTCLHYKARAYAIEGKPVSTQPVPNQSCSKSCKLLLREGGEFNWDHEHR